MPALAALLETQLFAALTTRLGEERIFYPQTMRRWWRALQRDGSSQETAVSSGGG